jgi:putative ABC transport system permease protein
MWGFAWANLRVRKIRTLLSLLGLAVAVAGVIGLVSLSAGITATLRDSLQLIRGVVVIQRQSMDPIFSKIPVEVLARVRAVPEVRAAAAEVWMLAGSVDGHATLTKSLLSAAAVGGMDDAGRATLSDGGFYRSHLVAGRWVEPGDRDVVVLSTQMAEEYDKRIGDPVKINGVEFTVVGHYRTGSLFLDQACVIPFSRAAAMRGYREEFVSAIYVEPHDRSPAGLEAAAHAIQAACAGHDVEALTPKRWLDHVATLLGTMDVFLLAVSSFACVVGALGVVNTMLMSVSERVREFGILKAVGWTRADVARLVVVEAVGLGVLGGAAGTVLGLGVVAILTTLLPFAPVAPGWVVGLGFFGAIGLGLVGGLYPAWRAASVDPVKAIRWE